MPGPEDPWSRLLAAQQRALRTSGRLDSLSMTEVRKAGERAGLDVANSIVSARLNLTVDGASTVTLGIDDPDWLLDRSGLLADDEDGHLKPVRLVLDGLAYRLVQATRRQWDVLELVFEDEVVALLRAKTRPQVASRNAVTRSQFIEGLVRQVKAIDIPFYSPEGLKKQPTAKPRYPETRPTTGETGFDDGATFKIKGVRADAQQMREVSTSLTVADQEGAKGRARLALLVAGIAESEFRAIMNRGGSPYGGVFQGDIRGRVFKLTDTEGMARSFLKGGKGFQANGAIQAAKNHPDWTPGRIALEVEGSRANFPSLAAGEQHYQKWIDEARKINDKWAGGELSADDEQVVTARQYQFKVGRVDGETETWWDGMQDLAEEVRWRLFAAGGAIAFASDLYLVGLPASHTFTGPLADGLREPPTYDRDNGKRVQEVALQVIANRYAVAPGSRVTLDELGPLDGRWLVAEVDQDLLKDDTEVTLRRALKPKKEPATEITTRTTGGGGTDGENLAGADRALKWARSKIGFYKEDIAANRGLELDKLERDFGMTGQPWCSMFATTAVAEGGVSRDCKTPLVNQVYAWAQAGTHGYQKGLRANPRPGDLILYNQDTSPTGDDHIGIVEKVDGNSVTSIEGNFGDQVQRRQTIKGRGVYVRPDYPN